MSYCADHREALREVQKYNISLPAGSDWLAPPQEEWFVVGAETISAIIIFPWSCYVCSSRQVLQYSSRRRKGHLQVAEEGLPSGTQYHWWGTWPRLWRILWSRGCRSLPGWLARSTRRDPLWGRWAGRNLPTGRRSTRSDIEDPEREDMYTSYLDARHRQVRRTQNQYRLLPNGRGRSCRSKHLQLCSISTPLHTQGKETKGTKNKSTSRTPPQKGDAKSRGKAALSNPFNKNTCLRCG